MASDGLTPPAPPYVAESACNNHHDGVSLPGSRTAFKPKRSGQTAQTLRAWKRSQHNQHSHFVQPDGEKPMPHTLYMCQLCAPKRLCATKPSTAKQGKARQQARAGLFELIGSQKSRSSLRFLRSLRVRPRPASDRDRSPQSGARPSASAESHPPRGCGGAASWRMAPAARTIWSERQRN